ncbi:hypothetical protein B296_00021076 [Ensete ventricosum]|uniref:Uncharacterized protein n=1 Tax=Ensete ventricosum TaxID=4639 RepID=A0A427ANL7_ENSVE|nr:hypothetical protein B296_00021076 [Ensete ventricosum]
MILLLSLQELMSMIFVQRKFCAFAPYFIFYVGSLHAVCALHHFPPTLLYSLVYIELMMALMPTIS